MKNFNDFKGFHLGNITILIIHLNVHGSLIPPGRVPYNNILDHMQLLNYVKSGRVMKRPKNCPKDL